MYQHLFNILGTGFTPNVSCGDAGGCSDPHHCGEVLSVDAVKVLDDPVQEKGLQCSSIVISAVNFFWSIGIFSAQKGITELLLED